ncbi:PEP-CTERM sorting domain-containing protein [Salinisphaera sp. SWV1]
MGYRERRDVPEPATWGMFGLGVAMIGVGVASRRRRSRAAGE